MTHRTSASLSPAAATQFIPVSRSRSHVRDDDLGLRVHPLPDDPGSPDPQARSPRTSRDRTLEGHESARARGKAIGGAAVTDDAMLAVALHLRGQELSPRDIAARLVIATGKKRGQHPSRATVLRILREPAAAAVTAGS